MGIKVGEYVRTENGHIGRIIKLSNVKGIFYIKYYIDGMEFKTDIEEIPIKAHSPNIIDLIEVGDIIKYKECFETKADEPNILNLRSKKEVDNFKKCIKYQEIIYMSVVTHEQFARMEYKV